MLEYVKRLLLMQTKLAAQFDAGQTPEIRETALHAEAVQTEDALMDETAAKTQKMEASERAKSDQTQEQTVEDKLRELTRQTMRMESLQQQKTAQKEQEQTRRLEAAMTALQERQMVELDKTDAGMCAERSYGELPADNDGCGHCVGSVAAVDAGNFTFF